MRDPQFWQVRDQAFIFFGHADNMARQVGVSQQISHIYLRPAHIPIEMLLHFAGLGLQRLLAVADRLGHGDRDMQHGVGKGGEPGSQNCHFFGNVGLETMRYPVSHSSRSASCSIVFWILASIVGMPVWRARRRKLSVVPAGNTAWPHVRRPAGGGSTLQFFPIPFRERWLREECALGRSAAPESPSQDRSAAGRRAPTCSAAARPVTIFGPRATMGRRRERLAIVRRSGNLGN